MYAIYCMMWKDPYIERGVCQTVSILWSNLCIWKMIDPYMYIGIYKWRVKDVDQVSYLCRPQVGFNWGQVKD